MNTTDTNDTASLGNTEEKLPPQRGARKWCFTINNYDSSTLDTLTQHFSIYGGKSIIGAEIAPTTNTPHYQGFVYFKNTIRLKTLKTIHAAAHWEIANGSIPQNIAYCSKSGNIVFNNLEETERPIQDTLKLEILSNEYPNITWKSWQQDVLDILESKPDSRTIHWFWEPIGNVGKSFLVKYITCKYNVIIADGKKNDVFNQVLTYLNTYKKAPSIILLDIPRTNEEYINYGAIEQLKNGCIYSGKYEGGQCVFPHPHVIIFANFAPDITSMSSDRWHIVKL